MFLPEEGIFQALDEETAEKEGGFGIIHSCNQRRSEVD